MAIQNDWSLDGLARRRDQYFSPGMKKFAPFADPIRNKFNELPRNKWPLGALSRLLRKVRHLSQRSDSSH